MLSRAVERIHKYMIPPHFAERFFLFIYFHITVVLHVLTATEVGTSGFILMGVGNSLDSKEELPTSVFRLCLILQMISKYKRMMLLNYSGKNRELCLHFLNSSSIYLRENPRLDFIICLKPVG